MSDRTPTPMPIEFDFLTTAIAICGSWESLVDFDSSGFDFTEEDAAALSGLFAEIEAEESEA